MYMYTVYHYTQIWHVSQNLARNLTSLDQILGGICPWTISRSDDLLSCLNLHEVATSFHLFGIFLAFCTESPFVLGLRHVRKSRAAYRLLHTCPEGEDNRRQILLPYSETKDRCRINVNIYLTIDALRVQLLDHSTIFDNSIQLVRTKTCPLNATPSGCVLD